MAHMTRGGISYYRDPSTSTEGTVLGTPNREPQEYSRNIMGIYLPGSSYSIIFLLYSWGSLFGFPIKSL